MLLTHKKSLIKFYYIPTGKENSINIIIFIVFLLTEKILHFYCKLTGRNNLFNEKNINIWMHILFTLICREFMYF